jgi:hypothetical protein
MPERWERELRKLSRLEMPSDVSARMERGPGPNALPPRRQRIVAGVVAFSVFAVAGAFAFQALRERSTPQPPLGTPPSWLADMARQEATDNGDPSPTLAEFALTDQAAVAPAVGLTGGSGDKPEYVVVLHGRFVAQGAKVPAGTAPPTGDILIFTVDPTSHAVIDFGLTDSQKDPDPDLSGVPSLERFEIAPVQGPLGGSLTVRLQAPPMISTVSKTPFSLAFFSYRGSHQRILMRGRRGYIMRPSRIITLPLRPSPVSLSRVIRGGTPIRITGDDATVVVSIWREGTLSRYSPVPLAAGVGILPVTPGEYVLRITATWHRGTDSAATGCIMSLRISAPAVSPP